MSLKHENKRAIKLAKEIIAKLDLNLDGQVILTEVGSNYYLFTPIIAALGNAKKVYALAKDSLYGRGEDIKQQCLALADMLNITNIEIAVNAIPEQFIREADIITNSGNLRPLDEKVLKKAKKGVVIPLMYEKWELRKEDIDIAWCKNNDIKVAGTWEEHPDIKVFGACGQLAIKLAHEAGYEVYDNKIIIWSDDHFGEIISDAFISSGAKEVITTVNYAELIKNINNCDFIFICDYDETRSYFGTTGSILNVEELINITNSFGVVHLYGEVDSNLLATKGINVYPAKMGKARHMTQTLGYVGLKPIINLQAAGFKVGELVARNEESSLVQLID